MKEGARTPAEEISSTGIVRACAGGLSVCPNEEVTETVTIGIRYSGYRDAEPTACFLIGRLKLGKQCTCGTTEEIGTPLVVSNDLTGCTDEKIAAPVTIGVGYTGYRMTELCTGGLAR